MSSLVFKVYIIQCIRCAIECSITNEKYHLRETTHLDRHDKARDKPSTRNKLSDRHYSIPNIMLVVVLIVSTILIKYQLAFYRYLLSLFYRYII